jgi:hypothetical protein
MFFVQVFFIKNARAMSTDDFVENVVGFVNWAICKSAGGLERHQVESIIVNERKKFPLGEEITLMFKTRAVISRDPNLQGSNCILSFYLFSSHLGHGVTTMTDPTSTERTLIMDTTGLGRDLEELVRGRLISVETDPQGRTIDLCKTASFDVKVTYEINSERHSFYINARDLSWGISDPDGLAFTTPSTDPGTFGPAGRGTPRTFQGLKAGRYTVTVNLAGTETADLTGAALAGNPLEIQRLAEEIARKSASATVNVVGVPTVKHLGILRGCSQEISVGETCTFEAQAAFEESCIPPRDVTGEAEWLPFNSNVFVAEEPDPVSISIASTSHPGLSAQACENASFEATLKYQEKREKITAKFAGKEANDIIVVSAPDDRSLSSDSSLSWTSPSGGPSFKIEQTDPVTVSVVHSSGLTDSAVIDVKSTINSVKIDPKKKVVPINTQIPFTANVSYAESCLDGDITSHKDVSWSDTNGGTTKSFNADNYGKFSKTVEFGGQKDSAEIWVPQVAIRPGGVRLKLDDSPFTFGSFLKHYPGRHEENITDTADWRIGKGNPPGVRKNVVIPDKCTGEEGFYLEATFNDPVYGLSVMDTARTVVEVDCLEFRRSLADIQRSRDNSEPGHLIAAKEWLKKREYWIERDCLCADLRVPDWMTVPKAKTSIRRF